MQTIRQGVEVVVARGEEVYKRHYHGREEHVGRPGDFITLSLTEIRDWLLPYEFTPDEARQLAAELVRLADEVEAVDD